MPSTRDIRRRIKSVKNTAQITRAMQMVASAKMRKAQVAALAGRPYALLMNEVLAAASAGAGEFTHPLLEVRPVRKRALVLITTAKVPKDVTVFVCAGKKGAQWVSRTKRELTAEFNYKDTPTFAEARSISKFVQQLFTDGVVDVVDVAFTNFISTLNQKPEVRQLLPIQQIKALDAGLEGEGSGRDLGQASREYLFEPGAPTVLGNLLPHYLNYQVFQFLQEAKASEQSARMVAMKNATDNAKQIIKDLTLEYNKLRQANITKELLEITSAAMAMGN